MQFKSYFELKYTTKTLKIPENILSLGTINKMSTANIAGVASVKYLFKLL